MLYALLKDNLSAYDVRIEKVIQWRQPKLVGWTTRIGLERSEAFLSSYNLALISSPIFAQLV